MLLSGSGGWALGLDFHFAFAKAYVGSAAGGAARGLGVSLCHDAWGVEQPRVGAR